MSADKSQVIVSVSGIRGIVGEGLTPELATRFAAALGDYLGRGTVVLSRDSRPSGEMFRRATMAGLMSVGCTVLDIGIAPTPTVGIAVRELGAVGGIQISASHNPPAYNGLKLFGPDGAVLPAEQGREVQVRYESGVPKRVSYDQLGQVRAQPDLEGRHIQAVCDLLSATTIASAGLCVLLDGNGGAGGQIGSALLRELGCSVVEHACEPNGQFIHDPEPTAEHLVDVGPLVPRFEAHLGCCLDPDSDRLALIDETGQCLSEELTLALAIKARLRQEVGDIVINMSTSRVVEDVAHEAGCTIHRSAVGEANVVAMMRERKALIGGEGNGGVIDPRLGWVRDPFIGMGLILSLMAEEGKPLSSLVAELPSYTMIKRKVAVERSELAGLYDRLTARWPDARVNRLDGLRLDLPSGWLHVRPSNTEPIVRVIAEANLPSFAQELAASVELL